MKDDVAESARLPLGAANQLCVWVGGGGQESWDPVFTPASLIPEASFSSAFDGSSTNFLVLTWAAGSKDLERTL